MNYHTPVRQKENPLPSFAERNGELVHPLGIFTREEYPTLPHDIVKIPAQDGRNIYVPLHKLKSVSSQDL